MGRTLLDFSGLEGLGWLSNNQGRALLCGLVSVKYVGPGVLLARYRWLPISLGDPVYITVKLGTRDPQSHRVPRIL